MLIEAATMYKCCLELTQSMTSLLDTIDDRLKRMDLPQAERCDLTYAAKVCHEMLSALRTRLNKTKDLQDRILWAKAVEAAVSGDPSAATIRTEYCTVTIKTDFAMSLPSRPRTREDCNNPELIKLGQWLGIDPEKMIYFESMRYSAIAEKLTEAVGKGEPVPVDPTKLHPIPKLIYRGKTPILEALTKTS